jgi:hypothetical protein
MPGAFGGRLPPILTSPSTSRTSPWPESARRSGGASASARVIGGSVRGVNLMWVVNGKIVEALGYAKSVTPDVADALASTRSERRKRHDV